MAVLLGVAAVHGAAWEDLCPGGVGASAPDLYAWAQRAGEWHASGQKQAWLGRPCHRAVAFTQPVPGIDGYSSPLRSELPSYAFQGKDQIRSIVEEANLGHADYSVSVAATRLAISNEAYGARQSPGKCTMQTSPPTPQRRARAIKLWLRRIYFGTGRQARAFRLGMLAFDAVLLMYFIIASFYPDAFWHQVLDFVIAALLSVEWILRLIVIDGRLRYFRRMGTWVDLVVIVSLLLPAFTEGLLFLRVLRFMRLFHSYQVLQDLRDHFELFRRNEEVIDASLNLAMFIFAMSAIVFVLQARTNPGINNYIDALYFTVTTLTTTGYGDILMHDTPGRLLAVAIMVLGFGLFLRLIGAIFRPAARKYTCSNCGLSRHERDAIHCKHCGQVVRIPTEGDVDLR
jgi:voltage-gated potassium channel